MGEISGDFILESRGSEVGRGRSRSEVGARSAEVGSKLVETIGLTYGHMAPYWRVLTWRAISVLSAVGVARDHLKIRAAVISGITVFVVDLLPTGYAT